MLIPHPKQQTYLLLLDGGAVVLMRMRRVKQQQQEVWHRLISRLWMLRGLSDGFGRCRLVLVQRMVVVRRSVEADGKWDQRPKNQGKKA